MKCLVTGHKGFIGKNLVSRLKKEGYEVLVLEKGKNAIGPNIVKI